MVNGDLPDFCCSFKFSNKEKTFHLHFNMNSVNASCCNVNSGSANVMHTLFFFLRLSLSESIRVYQSLSESIRVYPSQSLSESTAVSVFALFSDARGRGLLDFWNGGADVLICGRPNYLGSEISRKPKNAICVLIFRVGLII